MDIFSIDHCKLNTIRSVHNIRVERCWFDVNQGFGLKWKNFFMDLETFHGLIAGDPAHSWLVQHLFLKEIAHDAEEWRGVWNMHKMQLTGESNKSPTDMFVWGMIRHGIRGLVEEENLVDEEQYGIDWEALDDANLMEHYMNRHPEDVVNVDTFVPTPSTFSVVEVHDAHSPFGGYAENALDDTLHRFGLLNSGARDILHYRERWIAAMELYRYYLNTGRGQEAIGVI